MLDIFQFHHPVGEEFQRPALSPIGSLATGQMNQLGFSFAIQAPTLGTFTRKASGESHLQVLLDKPLFDANHRAATNVQPLSNLPIGVTGFALMLIAHEQNACHQIVPGWSTAHAYHRLQPSVLLLTGVSQDNGSDTGSCLLSFMSVGCSKNP